MSATRLVDIIIQRKEANKKNQPLPATREALLSWISEEKSTFHRQSFLNQLYSIAPDWLSIVQNHLNDFIPLISPLQDLTLAGLHIWQKYYLSADAWRDAFWQTASHWFEDPYELLKFIRHIPHDCLADSLRRSGLAACLKRLPPAERYQWMADLYAANSQYVLGIEVIIILLSDLSLAEQKNILLLLENSYLKARPLRLQTLGALLNALHTELFPLFFEKFAALFCLFTTKEFEFGTKIVLPFLEILQANKHQAFFELFNDEEIQFWISGLLLAHPFARASKQMLVDALVNCSSHHNVKNIIQLRTTFAHLLELASDPEQLLKRLTDPELEEIMLCRGESIAQATQEVVALNLDEKTNALMIEALRRIFTFQYGEKNSLYGKFSSTLFKRQYELDSLALGAALQPGGPINKLSG